MIEARYLYSILLFCLVGCVLKALTLGAIDLSLQDIWYVVRGQLASDSTVKIILLELRLPRVMLALAVGLLLAVSGAICQSLFRNALADPSLIGVNAGCSLGASLAFAFGASHALALQIPLVSVAASLGGMLSVFLVYQLASRKGYTSVADMLLIGVALAAIVGAFHQGLQIIVDDHILRRMSLWFMGSLGAATMLQAAFAIFAGIALLLVLPLLATAFNSLLLGEAEAQHLGINTKRLKVVSILLVAFSVGLTVALVGPIAFVGLVVPHICRILVGPDHRTLLPACAMMGALLLLLADTVARSIVAPSELPVGLITALLGAPFFIFLIIRRRYQESNI